MNLFETVLQINARDCILIIGFSLAIIVAIRS